MPHRKTPGAKKAGPPEPSREDLRKAEKEIGENIPDEMVGLDTEDVGDVDTDR